MNEDWKIGLDWIGLDWIGLEGWKIGLACIGRLEDWKIGRLEDKWEAGKTLEFKRLGKLDGLESWSDFEILEGLGRLESLESLEGLWKS